MKINSIINKAISLGIDIDYNSSISTILENIANELGLDNANIETIDNALDKELANLEESNNDEIEYLDDSLNNENPVSESSSFSETKDKKKILNENDDNDENKSSSKNTGQKNPKLNKNANIESSTPENFQRNFMQNRLNNIKNRFGLGKNESEGSEKKDDKKPQNNSKPLPKPSLTPKKSRVEKAGETVRKVINTFKTVIKFLMSNPIILIIIGIVLLIFFIIILFQTVNNKSDSSVGYYDSKCNFNEISINVKSCNEGETSYYSLEDYVIGATYSLINNGNYSDETIKAIMIVEKTNALSNGGYSQSKTSVTIDDCNSKVTETSSIDNNTLNKLKKLYDLIKDELFVSVSYDSAINSLSNQNSLDIDITYVEKMQELSSSGNYESILKQLYNNEEENSSIVVGDRDSIFIGDSRLAGMKNAGLVNSDNSVYGTAMGYSWFVGNKDATGRDNNCLTNAISCVNNKLSSNANILIWLGVNDLGNYKSYYDKYYELATGEWINQQIYIVSVGYVDDDRSSNVKNANIDTFNSNMKSSIESSGLDNLHYLDLGYTIEETKNNTSDGVHYKSEFSKEIYNKMLSLSGGKLEISSTKGIYKLGDHCTFYSNVTENEAYWWPIGSANPTSGNIYGGTPTATRITSKFGPRDSGFHHGLDIGVSIQNVVVATKDGTVSFVSNTCDNNGYIGNKCGGSYGNYIMIDHGDGTVSLYAHLYPDSITVSIGSKVSQGQKIALSGNSGNSSGAHLHFEIRINGVHQDPLEYIDPDNPRPVTVYTLASLNENVTSAEETKAEICKTLLKSGYSKDAVAGILTNMKEEGGFRTNNLQNSYETKLGKTDITYTQEVDSGKYTRDQFVNDSAGYGLIQWTSSGRKAGLYDLAKSQNKSISNLQVQLNYMFYEFTYPSYAITQKYVTGNYSHNEIAYYFCTNYERPKSGESGCRDRANSNSKNMYDYVNNNCS